MRGEREAIERHLNFARNLHVEARLLHGDDVARTLAEFARPPEQGLGRLLGRGMVQQIVRLARDMQVTVAADRPQSSGG